MAAARFTIGSTNIIQYIAEDGLYDLERVTDRLAYTIIYDRYRRLINN